MIDFSWLPQYSPMVWATTSAAVLLGGTLRGLTGFGAALVMAPLMSLVLSATETLCLVTVLCALPMGQSVSRRIIRLSDGALLRPMITASALGIPCGVWLITQLPSELFGTVLGVAVVGSAIALLARKSVAGKGSRSASAGIGLVSGILTGFGGIGGPPAILYVLGIEQDPHRARANFIVFFACIYPLALLVITVLGVMTWGLLIQGLVLAPLFHIGGIVGTRLFLTMSKRYFRPAVLVLLVAAGAMAAYPRNAAAADHENSTQNVSSSWCVAHCCGAQSLTPNAPGDSAIRDNFPNNQLLEKF